MNHLREWRKSGVDDELICLNVRPLRGEEASERLLYSDELPRRNDGRLSQPLLQQYAHLEAGGWWCSGIDILTGESDLWGCFKPVQPRLSCDRQKPIKYEHPPRTPTGIFALKVPDRLWQQIAERSNIAMDSVRIDPNLPDRGFWQWLSDHPQVPICITEGVKKAGAILTAGYAAIALPGINNGYRTPRDDAGNRTGKSFLIPQLQKLAVSGREIYIAFDQDAKPATVQAVKSAIRRLGYLLSQQGAAVKVATWPPDWGKGIDDVIGDRGSVAFDEIYRKALPLEMWKAIGLNRLTYEPTRQVHARYLPPISVPSTAKLVGIQSPKGTGKTHLLTQILSRAQAEKRRILVIGHRVRLVEELCQRFGIPYIGKVRDNPFAQKSGFGLCIDSLHPDSQASFNALDWRGATIVIDEVEQVLWHGLNSDTCKGHRVSILKSLKTLMEQTLGGEGQVLVADADLSDVSLDYLMALGGVTLDPHIIQNDWRSGDREAWTVYNYEDNSPKRLIKDLVKHVREGGKPFVCLSAQKLSSQWGTNTLESYLRSQFPDRQILRIDSETLAEPSHPAYKCLQDLERTLPDYDIVLASPSIETGISIDIKGHFTSVWAIAQGIQTATSVCQAIGRVRESVPRHIWIADYAFNQVGNGSTSIPHLLTSGHRLTQLNIRLLQQSDLQSLDDLDTGFQAESLLCWAKMAVRVNAAMIRYRESVIALLVADNHRIVAPKVVKEKSEISEPPLPSAASQLTEAINAVRQQNYESQCEEIASASDLSGEQYQQLKKRLVKTLHERQALQKYDLHHRYGIPVTPELVRRDDGGWYGKLRLHYYLTLGRPYLADRDAIVAQKLIQQGEGSLFLPDFNGSQLGAAIGTLEVLGVPILLANPARLLSGSDPDLQQMAELAIQNRSEIKTILGIGIASNAAPIPIVRRLLDAIGFGIQGLGMKVVGKKRVRAYQLASPEDEREEVFEQWLNRDRRLPGSSEPWFIDHSPPASKFKKAKEAQSQDFIQLSLLDRSG